MGLPRTRPTDDEVADVAEEEGRGGPGGSILRPLGWWPGPVSGSAVVEWS